MLSQALELRELYNRIALEEVDLAHYMLSDHDWLLVKQVKQILSTFNKIFKSTTATNSGIGEALRLHYLIFDICTDAVSLSGKKVTADTKISFPSLRNVNKEVLESLGRAFRPLNTYFTDVENYKLLLIPSLLDPRFKTDVIKANHESHVAQALIREISETIRDECGKSYATQPCDMFASDFNCDDDEDDLFPVYHNPTKQDELDLYLLQPVQRVPPEGVMQWWRDNSSSFQALAKLARKYLCVQPSSLSLARLVNMDPEFLANRRTQMSEGSMRQMVLGRERRRCNGVVFPFMTDRAENSDPEDGSYC
ncbi:hypothetical protein BABINDRAFT_9854 [Babjeviella inositovora NRRL Y-12698]|uniref:HAT C-terminal dimerisation domain-containing protein n=1 Tax=Babjeviella inositovora NRRL Y-12698 TaxID=984486 RepID=A0A1E3QJK6_9ASCO|nr:uncharacterized protein BABINDRAFT_9854 [Babjeviella inositovora NRRL Y-12698]ODQ77873.1 hypothetical protein BABINDRAFT_9854 [Babjeviella inositovora NRRL Y-12698]